MRTTTVIWKTLQLEEGAYRTAESAARRQRYLEAATNLAGVVYELPTQETFTEDENNEKCTVVKRTWPSLEAAQAWVSFVLAEGAISAVVDPE